MFQKCIVCPVKIKVWFSITTHQKSNSNIYPKFVTCYVHPIFKTTFCFSAIRALIIASFCKIFPYLFVNSINLTTILSGKNVLNTVNMSLGSEGTLFTPGMPVNGNLVSLVWPLSTQSFPG